jgi:G:T-mismatch repair DNA endonuclease (very short patch repair protein)
LFKEDFYHPQLKKTAKEKWKLDLERQKYLESAGYNITIVWENELEEYIKQYDKFNSTSSRKDSVQSKTSW